MKKFILPIIAMFFATVTFGQAWNYQWALGIGSPGQEREVIKPAVDSQDNTYLALEYRGELNVGGTTYPTPADEGRDILIVKISANGDVLWSGSITGDGSANSAFNGDRVDDIHVDADDNVIVIGNIGFNGSVFGTSNGLSDSRNFITKINPDGDVLWEVYANDDYLNDEFTALTSDADGNIYVTGRTDDFAGNIYGIGGTDISSNDISDWTYIMAKLTPDGVVEYVEELPTGVPTEIRLDSNGDFVISSQYGENEVSSYALQKISAIDFSVIWQRENIHSAQNTSLGGNLGFHIKEDNSIVQFLKTQGDLEYDDSELANCDFHCPMGIMINIDADGNTVSLHAMEPLVENPQFIGLSQNFIPSDFAAIDDNTFYITGRMFNDVEFSNGYTLENSDWYLGDFGDSQDAFVIKVDNELNLLEYAAQTGTAAERGKSLAVYSNGDAALTGVYEIETFGGLTGSTFFGDEVLESFGQEDYFLTRLSTGTEAPLGVKELDHQLSFSIFPNPSSEFTNIAFENSKGTNALIDVIDITGKIVSSERVAGNGSIQHQIETSHLTPGLYTVRLTTENSVGTKSFVVNR